ncbi:hypothetical protein DB347_04650 [Opitutaceae bacterium EW11]|nr:hypothetical protein DB347_04650 [Opitutaceae bacterium EW11]
MKTVRFKQLVEACGRPEVKALWGPAKSDRELQRAIKEARVLTVHQENVGTKKDWGVIGFWPEHTAQYLIFPKSLKRFSDRRVIGIDYSVVEPDTSAPERKAVAAKPARHRKTRSAKPKKNEARSKPEPSPRPAPSPQRAPAPSRARGSEVVDNDSDLDRAHMLREVRLTLGELEAGKTEPALRRLERLAEALEER